MILRGNGFILRGWRQGDEVSLQKNANNPKISGCLGDSFPSPYTMEAAVEFVSRKIQQEPILNFALDVNCEVAGAAGIELKADVWRKTAVIGYWLGEEFWGRGIMTEAVKLVTAYAFEKFDFIRIEARVYHINPRSMRVLEKAGYHKEAVLKNSAFKNGEVLDEHIYVILRN
jgi:RimJ/RimL family protein N-acetyltransferase